MDRKEAYEQIKKLNLQEECKKKFGKNFTQCKTSELEVIIRVAKVGVGTVKPTKKSTRPTNTENECICGDKKDLISSFKDLIKILKKRHILLESDVKEILG